MPSWVEPQLATLTRDRFSSPEWVFERKLDGERCLAFADAHGVRLMTRNQRDGWEGLITKRADAPYQGGRSRDWLKFKCENAQEFVVGGFTDPQRSRVGLGALLLGYYDPDGQLRHPRYQGLRDDKEPRDVVRELPKG